MFAQYLRFYTLQGKIGFFLLVCNQFSRYELYLTELFLEKQDVHKLMLFEEQCTESYLQQKDTLFHATPEERVRAIGTR